MSNHARQSRRPLPRLALTAGKANWGVPFRFGLVRVEDADMALIADAMGCAAVFGA